MGEPDSGIRVEPPRRAFLKKGLLGAALLALGGTAATGLRPTRRVRLPSEPLMIFSPAEYAIFAAVAARIVSVPEGVSSTESVDVALRADRVMALALPSVQKEFGQLLRLFENGLTGVLTGTSLAPFTASSRKAQSRRLLSWSTSRVPLFRTGFQAMKRLAVACYYSAPQAWKSIGYPGPPELVYVETPETAETAETAA